MVCNISRLWGGTAGHSNVLTAKLALPVLVGNSRESRGGCGSWKPSGCADFAVVVVATGHDGRDSVADGVVVVVELFPRHGVVRPKQGARQFADDRDLAAHLVAWRMEAAARQVHHRHRILNGYLPLRCLLDVAVGAAERGQDQGRRPMDEVATVQFRRNLNRQRAGAQGGLGYRGVRGGRGEVAAHAHEHLGAAVAHRPDRVDGVHAVLARADDAEPGVERGQEVLGHLLPDAHRAVALDVGMAAHRAQPGARLADHAAHQQQVGDSEIVGTAWRCCSGP